MTDERWVEPRILHNRVALDSLLPLLESHLDAHGSIVARAQWVSPPEPKPPGYVPPPPEPDCKGACKYCGDFHTADCQVRQERWASEWARLRLSYPVLMQLEAEGGLLEQLAYENLRWRLAIHMEYVQEWSAWYPDERKGWAWEGVKWLAKECKGWLPIYVPKGLPEPEKPREAKRRWVGDMIVQGFTQSRICAVTGCSPKLVAAVRKEIKQPGSG
jgi:hypothetical protein